MKEFGNIAMALACIGFLLLTVLALYAGKDAMQYLQTALLFLIETKVQWPEKGA